MNEPASYFLLSNQDKVDALETAASILGRPSDLLEKDIWVVWTLGALFESDIGDHLVFKGGTSLSKAYKAIDRFSEDVDLTHDIRQIIPDLITDPENPYPPSRSQAQKWTEAVRERLSDWVKEIVLPILENQIKSESLPASLREEGDKIYLDYEAVRSGTGYVRPSVLLEFGARSTGEPANRHEVHCDIFDALPELRTPTANPRVMSAQRTFWEKATAIHAYCLRGEFRGGDRYARHWFDLDCLDKIGIAQDAIDDRPLARDTAKHKQHFFREKSQSGEVIDYGAAVTGQLCLVPKGEAFEALEHDYSKMLDAGLLRQDVDEFGEMIARLKRLQHRANAS